MKMIRKICSAIALVLVCSLTPKAVTTVNGQVHQVDMKVIQGGGAGQCPSVEEREKALNEIHQTVDDIIPMSYPESCGISEFGWRRVAFINMSDTSYNCPPGLRLTTYSKRTCGRAHTGWENCSSTTFSVGGLPYSQVCGRMRGYQYGVLVAFFAYNYYNLSNIDYQYVDGISLTHGGSGERQHIWTFAAGLTQSSSPYNASECPCDSPPYLGIIPPFVGNDYLCESGLQTDWYVDSYNYTYYHTFYANNPLWDGHGCIANSTCCQFNNPPWFTKHLNVSTTDDIELRLCIALEASYGDVALELIELYVK